MASTSTLSSKKNFGKQNLLMPCFRLPVKVHSSNRILLFGRPLFCLCRCRINSNLSRYRAVLPKAFLFRRLPQRNQGRMLCLYAVHGSQSKHPFSMSSSSLIDQPVLISNARRILTQKILKCKHMKKIFLLLKII